MDGNNFDVVKSFNASVKEYHHQRTESVSQKLQRYLQILSATPDNRVFDPNTTDGSELYVNLHDLMNSLDSRSGLMWCAINVLEEAGKNPAAQHALVHTFKFTPILTQLLGAHLIHDKRIKILRLLQNCTYSIKILWQDAYLPMLISTLIKWVTEYEKDGELVSLSLGVLVNLCYKNLPAVYTLRRIIDVKEFVQAILGQTRDILDVRVQAYRLLIILEELTGDMPDTEILAGVKWTYTRLLESFESKSGNVMRHLVDYFKDIQNNKNFKDVLLKYPSYRQDMESLIKQLENQIPHIAIDSSECVSLLLEFLQSLIVLQLPDMESLYKRLIQLTLSLTGPNMRIGKNSFNIIKTIVIQSRKNGMRGQETVDKLVEDALPVLLSLMDERHVSDFDSRSWMTDLLGLFLEISKIPALQNIIASSLNPLCVKKFFHQVLAPEDMENLFDNALSAFYIQGTLLVFSLANTADAWRELSDELMQHKTLQMRLAAAMYTGPTDIKLQVLQLVAHLSSNSRILFQLSQCMAELNGIVLSAAGPELNRNTTGFVSTTPAATPHDQSCSTPLFTLAQQGRLDHCINTVQQALTNNELNSIGTAAVLELYQYRVAAMSHTESILQSNLQAVDSHCTQLRHRVAVMTSETSRLLSLLHSKEQGLETLKSSITSLQSELHKMEKSFHSARNQHSQAVQDLKSKGKIIDEMIKKNEQEQKELKETIKNLQKELKDKEESLRIKIKELKDSTQTLEHREKKITKQDNEIRDLEKRVCEKDDEIAQYQSEIAELEEMRDVIMKVAKDKEKKNRSKK